MTRGRHLQAPRQDRSGACRRTSPVKEFRLPIKQDPCRRLGCASIETIIETMISRVKKKLCHSKKQTSDEGHGACQTTYSKQKEKKSKKVSHRVSECISLVDVE